MMSYKNKIIKIVLKQLDSGIVPIMNNFVFNSYVSMTRITFLLNINTV